MHKKLVWNFLHLQNRKQRKEDIVQSVSLSTQSLGGSLSDAASNFGNSVGNAIAGGASSLGGLLDINPSPTEEQQPVTLKKRKKPGIRMS